MKSFAFNIGQTVKMATSDEHGEVVGRAEYGHCENSYFIRYKAGNGCQCESWHTESALVAA